MTMFAISAFLVAQGHTVRCIAPRNPNPDKVCKEFETFDYRGIEMLWDLPKELWDDVYETAHCVITHLDCTREVVAQAKKHNLPVVHLIHNEHQLAYHRVQPHEASLIVYNSFHLANKIRFPAPSLVVYPPVDIADYIADPAASRDKYSILNCNENKGGQLFWNLVGELPERKFLCQKGSYADQIVPKHIPKNAEVRQNTSDVKSIYAQTHVMLMPSKSETWGRVAIEAAANGIPVIANPTDGLVEALGRDNAVWVDWKDVNGWLNAIAMLDDKNLYMKYSLAGYNRARELQQLSLIQLTALEQSLFSISHSERKRLFTLASEPQYLDHIAPIVHAMASEHTGFTCVFNNGHNDFPEVLRHSYEHNLLTVPIASNMFDHPIFNSVVDRMAEVDSSVLLVSSWRDQVAANKTKLVSRIVRTEHGSGQSFQDCDDPAFIGGKGHQGILAAFTPGDEQSGILRETEPMLKVASIGCPKLDAYSMRRARPGKNKLVVAVSFRYSMGGQEPVPELTSGFDHFRADIENLATSTEMALVGHGHPYAMKALAPWWKALQVPLRKEFDDIMECADVLIVDQSSIALEWLQATNKPIILMNSPSYRRYVRHGLRFWDIEQEDRVFPANPGQLTEKFILNAAEAQELAPLKGRYYSAPVGSASTTARDFVMRLLHDEARDGIQVKMIKSVDYGGQFRKAGDILWVSEVDSKNLVGHRFAVEIHRNDPEVVMPESINLADKQNWPIKNFIRYYQLLVPKWS